jgi:MFS transporter, DHA1 family, staphyloferrin A biosynthesis exporter
MDEDHFNPERTETTTGSAARVGTFASLRIPDFRLLLTSTLLSNAAQWIQQITLNWLIYNMTGSGTMLGAINLVRSVSTLGMIPVAGLLIDRLNRRGLMVTTNCWLFAITLAMALLLLVGHAQVWHLFVFTFLGGLAQAIDQALRQVVVFDLVPRALIPNAVAIIQTGWSLMRSFGPGVGGFLILWLGPGGNFFIQAGAYVLIAIAILQIGFPKREGDVHRSALENILAGIRHVAGGRITRTFMLMGFVLPLFTIPIFITLLPIYAVEVFGDETGKTLGVLMASVGVGGIMGGVVTASLDRMDRRGLVQLSSLFLLNLPLVGFALSKTLWVAMLFLALTGVFEMIFLTTNQTLLQLSIPNHLRGRVTSVVSLNMALSPLGGMIAGMGSDLLGGPKIITMILASISAGVAICVFLCSKTVRNYRLSQAIARD